MEQTLFNIVVSIVGFLGAGLITLIWQEIRSLQRAERALADKLVSIEILVAGDYIRRTELKELIDDIHRRLDRFEEHLDSLRK